MKLAKKRTDWINVPRKAMNQVNVNGWVRYFGAVHKLRLTSVVDKDKGLV